MLRPACPARIALAAIATWAALMPRDAAAIELGEGFAEIHGFYQMEFRGIADSFELTDFNPHQWAHTLNVEAEFDLLPDGWGPISLLQAFVRVEARYDCVWQSLCHIATGQRLWGDEANRAPSQFTNGRSSGYSGRFPNPGSPSEEVHGSGSRLVTITEIPPLDAVLALGGEATAAAVARTLGPIEGSLFAVKHVQGSVAPSTLPLGPWVPRDVKANGALRALHTLTPTPSGPQLFPSDRVPLRPSSPDRTLFTPSTRLAELIEDFDDLDVNFSEEELEWNRGASQQQTKELREAYIDLELLDGQLFIRAGRQTTVWGKTELFRAQDQFNPQDIALATLSSLESSRIPLWSLRAIWSFWDVGPLQDVRLEFATNLDHYEPTDLGTCGEPYTIFLACLKKTGAFGHGLLGIGLAGEERPPDPWNDSRGLEVGLRLEFRYGRFSFALTDFYGFPDFPITDNFNEYERNVDPFSGRPRIAGAKGSCALGTEPACLTPENAEGVLDGLRFSRTSGNRQFFDVLCSATLGLGGAVLPELDADCILDIFNTTVTILPPPASVQIRRILGLALGGGRAYSEYSVPMMTYVGYGPLLVELLGGVVDTDFVPPVLLHGGSLDDVNCPPGSTSPTDPGCVPYTTQWTADVSSCGNALTDQQMALLGTGRFYHRDANAPADICQTRGIDLFHAEANVLLEAFPQFDGPVATRFIPGMGQVMLPGSRGPGDPGYDPLIDGCVMDLPDAIDNGECDDVPGGSLIDPRTGQVFRAETTALSYNFLALLVSLSPALPDNQDCDPSIAFTPGANQIELLRCSLVAGVFGIAGARRPELSAGGDKRYGRRDFLWHGGSEIRLLYKRRNVFGASMDFAEDYTKTNWGMEFVWFEDDFYGDTHEKKGWSRHDTVSLTVSVDRPTFINFLNANRTVFFNAQFFVRYIDGYTDKRLTPDGPFSLLATLTFFTGFWQDRLLTATTLVHELESNSSGLIASFTYRMSERFSVGVGLTTFRGEPRSARMARVPASLSATSGNDYESRMRYNGLSAVADREELFLNIRYTF